MVHGIKVSLNDISKSYPGVQALDYVSIEFQPGEVHAIAGENGAGKSTLIKCISGAISPSSGYITIDGKDYNTLTPRLSKDLGIETIYQEFNVVPTLSAAENVFLGSKDGGERFVNLKKREKKAEELFKQLNVNIKPSALVRDLSPACQQIIEIAKAISHDVKFLIMDEPTAPLTLGEVEVLFEIIGRLKKKGITILYISHRLEEIFRIADRVTIMRDGCYIDTKNIEDTSRNELITMMAGRPVSEAYPKRNHEIGEEMLRVEDLCGNGLEHINFSLKKGEILGFAGLVGAGRTELMQMIYGVVPAYKGKIFINGKEVKNRAPVDAIRNGIGLIPEDRKMQGAFLKQTIQWNISINAVRNISKFSVVDTKKERKMAEGFQSRFQIKTPSLFQRVENLSGGNQQKVVIAKTLAANADVLIFDEPTRGIDVTAKQQIYALMNELAENGHALIMVSSDMPELIGMCDRIIVISEGHYTGSLSQSEFDQSKILELATENRSMKEAILE